MRLLLLISLFIRCSFASDPIEYRSVPGLLAPIIVNNYLKITWGELKDKKRPGPGQQIVIEGVLELDPTRLDGKALALWNPKTEWQNPGQGLFLQIPDTYQSCFKGDKIRKPVRVYGAYLWNKDIERQQLVRIDALEFLAEERPK